MRFTVRTFLPILVGVCFVGFLYQSIHIEREIDKVKDASSSAQVDDRKPAKIPVDYVPQGKDKLTPKPKESPAKDSSNGCVHTTNRDYKREPIAFERGFADCDVPCGSSTDKYTDFEPASVPCPHTKRYTRTMENTPERSGDDRNIVGDFHLTADVPVQYFSWAEYDFMRPVKPKVEKSMMVAAISNCVADRLDYLQELMDNGVTVDSVGRCRTNKEVPAIQKGNGWQERKTEFLAQYKFTFTFENSREKDYVTEKMFDALVAGSVPVYRGAPNARKFAPNNHSVIFADDFASPKELAEYLKKLDKDDNLYREYLSWKRDGPSLDFMALVDLSVVHSACRFCIKAADIDRKTVGEVTTGPYEEENDEEMKKFTGTSAIMLKIRERGKFWLRRIHLVDRTYKELRQANFQLEFKLNMILKKST
eukprot:TRINITY_DN6339_c0_g1_i3.p1 TRINITY_DN6339_c0_g1~~TRINITY_DN6339_c0_g1_i3.p1  ORF type:complete len:422 (+),score=109.33 TRINITY_DN6339_c0_g1_i3:3-1268(+)